MNVLEFVYLVYGNVAEKIHESDVRFFGVYTTIEMAYQVKACKEEEYFEKFKKKHPDVTVDKEDFAFNVMMVPVDKAIDNEIGEYFE